MKLVTRMMFAVGWLVSCVANAQDPPRVIAELGSPTIYEGESVQYIVAVDNLENPPTPKLDGFEQFDVRSAGSNNMNSTNIVLTPQGRRTTRTYRTAFIFVLTPKQSGTLELPAPTVEIDGTTIRGNPLTLRVVAPDDQDLVLLDIQVDRPHVYPMQPFTVLLSIAVKGLPDPLQSRNPLDVQNSPPALSIPWVVDDDLPEGLEPRIDWKRWLGGMKRPGQIGFSVNNLRDTSFLLLEGRTLRFLPQGRQIRLPDRSGEETAYWEFTFARQFSSNKAGPYQFGPVTLKGRFASSVDSQGRLRGEDVYAIGKAATIEVREPPPEGRPESYIGAIGRFTIDTSLVPTKAKVGDPLTLSLTLKGEGTLDSTVAPRLEQIPGFEENFRVYEATTETAKNSRRFTYSLRPKRASIEQFPAVPVSYFDVEKERYVTVNTDLIPLAISEAVQLSSSEIARSARLPESNGGLEVRQEGIFANVSDTSALIDQRVHPARWCAGIGSMLGLYLVILVAKTKVQEVTGNKELLRRRAAPSRARRRLKEALDMCQQDRSQDAADQVRAALVGLVADIANVPEGGLTSTDAGRLLRERGVESDLIDRMQELLEQCEGVRYGGSGDDIQELDRQAENLLAEMIVQLKKRMKKGAVASEAVAS